MKRARLMALQCGLAAVVATVAHARIDLVFPTPQKAWTSGRIEEFIQPTVSGDPESGLFGCVRSGGSQFHEGLDLKPTTRDRRGEPADPVFAAMDGVVKHVSQSPGSSNYGRYIVIEHPEQTPAVYTLYAHLARIEPGIRPGVRVQKGQTIGLMGRSAGGYAIPKERGHLHFEIGLRATDNFEAWYAMRRFGNRNEHGDFNGMNLMGIDPLDFLRAWRTGRVDSFQEYFDKLRPVVTLRVATTRVPDFIRRYPSLLRKPINGLVAGWEVACNATGLPFAWTPLSGNEVIGMRAGEVRVVSADTALARAHRCKDLVRVRGGSYAPGGDLRTMIEQVFGIR
ncbi:M23 family metallopeptidase [Oleiharenicola sp. Vm1]|uniref:M23 family metallopeptidase n=1 Tax=Oleiharenicola sp. Vm1 TaxID=3398393 RepID=UPI0039F55F18